MVNHKVFFNVPPSIMITPLIWLLCCFMSHQILNLIKMLLYSFFFFYHLQVIIFLTMIFLGNKISIDMIKLRKLRWGFPGYWEGSNFILKCRFKRQSKKRQREASKGRTHDSLLRQGIPVCQKVTNSLGSGMKEILLLVFQNNLNLWIPWFETS